MTVIASTARRAINIGGVEHDLSHLEQSTHQVQLNLRGGFQKLATVVVSYSNHCYSRSPRQGEQIPAGHCVPDGPRSAPRDRIFSAQRYELSKHLPAVLQQLLSGTEDGVFESNHHNFIRLEVMTDTGNGTSTTMTYYVFLAMRKVKEDDGQPFIKVTVESAYPEDALERQQQPRLNKPFAFGKLLAMCWEGHPDGDTGRRPTKRKKKKAPR